MAQRAVVCLSPRENQRIAEELRSTLGANGTLALSITGSDGAGKTAFLERTLQMLPPGTNAAVLTADRQGRQDARRLASYGFPVRYIQVPAGCHLNASMVQKHLAGWDLRRLDLLFIEIGGSLEYPASYDLGQDARVVVLGVTESEDEPLNNPGFFRNAEVMIVNKTDLLPYVPFQADFACENAWSVCPELEIIRTSTITGDGFGEWMNWLAGSMAAKTFPPRRMPDLRWSLQRDVSFERCLANAQ